VGELGHIAYLSDGTSTGGDGGGTAPTITTTTLAYGTVDRTYNQIISLTGEAPVTLSIESGSLPAGLTFSSMGVISGKPTAKGKFTFTVKATNAKGSNTKQLSITITGRDDLTWTDVPVGPFDAGDGSMAFAYGNNKFVTGGASGKMAYSSNGISWTAVSDSKFGNSPIRSMIYGNNKFVAVGHSGKIAYSSDGLLWTLVSNSSFGSTNIRSIAYNGNNKYVAVGESGKMAYSSDGESWTAVSNSRFSSTNITAIAYGNNKYVAVGESGKMAYSSDGESWTAVSNSRFGSSTIYAIAYGNNKFVAVGNEGKMAYSSDGESWKLVEDRPFSSSSYYVYTIAYGNGMFVAGGYFGSIIPFSYDGEYWTNGSDIKYSGMDTVMIISFGNGKFFASNDKGKMIYSSDIPTPVGTAPTITTTSLSSGTVGTSYSQTLIATGDTPIEWRMDSGALPGGLSLSNAGVIQGTPTAAGTFSFTVKAASIYGNNTKQLSITIAAGSDNPNPGGGTFTLTGIPSQYDGKYAFFLSGHVNNDNFKVIGAQFDYSTEELTNCEISNGSVSLPMWKCIVDNDDNIIDIEPYSGNDMVVFYIIIYASSDDFDASQALALASFETSVTFSNGIATRSWSQADNTY